MKLLIHVGRHKTGTTSLQKFFVLNESLLRRANGIVYPSTGRIRNYHHGLFLPELNIGQPIDITKLHALRDELRNSAAEAALVSTEVLSRTDFPTSDLHRIAEVLGEFEPDIIVYLRRQDDYVESFYAELVKNGACRPPQNIRNMDFGCDYYQFVSGFADAFGQDNIRVRLYDSSPDFSIYHDFCDAIGIDWNASFELPSGHLNTRLPWSYIALLRQANRSDRVRSLVWNRHAKRITRSLASCFPRLSDLGRPMTDADRQQLMREYDESNNRVAREFLGRDILFN